MKKILLFIIFVLFTAGCSNISTQNYNISDTDKRSLLVLIESIKDELKDGEFDILDSTLASGMKNSMLKKELATVDFSQINIMTSKPVFNKNTARNVVALVFGSNTLYFNVEYLLKNGEWKILNFKERRG